MFNPVLLSFTRSFGRTALCKPGQIGSMRHVAVRRLLPSTLRIPMSERVAIRTESQFRRQPVVRPVRTFCTVPLARKIEASLVRISFLMHQPEKISSPNSTCKTTLNEFWTDLLNLDIDLPLFKVTPLEKHHWNALIDVITHKPELVKEEISLPTDISESRLVELFNALRIDRPILPAISFTCEAKQKRLGFVPEVCLKSGSVEELSTCADLIRTDAIPQSYLQAQNIELTDSNIAKLSQTIVRLQPGCLCDLSISPASNKIRK